jgi:hypothetical protein
VERDRRAFSFHRVVRAGQDHFRAEPLAQLLLEISEADRRQPAFENEEMWRRERARARVEPKQAIAQQRAHVGEPRALGRGHCAPLFLPLRLGGGQRLETRRDRGQRAPQARLAKSNGGRKLVHARGRQQRRHPRRRTRGGQNQHGQLSG